MTMEIRPQREVLDQMVASHRLSLTEAEEILNAPRFKVLWREVLSYIAVLVIGVGLIRVVGARNRAGPAAVSGVKAAMVAKGSSAAVAGGKDRLRGADPEKAPQTKGFA